jgi:colanic acid/amylovoran biosynthesis protein
MTPGPPRILILHGINIWNTGDQALLQAMVTRLRDELGADVEIRIEDVFDLQERTLPDLERLKVHLAPPLLPVREAHGWTKWRWLGQAVLAWWGVLLVRLFGRRGLIASPSSIRAGLAEMLDADLVLSKAGGHLYSTHERRIASSSYLITIWASGVLGRPTMLYAQSVGPFSGRVAGMLAARSLRRVTAATAREELSHRWLQRHLGSRTRIELTADEAFTLQGPPTSAAGEHTLLGMTAIAWRFPDAEDAVAARAAYEDALAEVAQWWIDERQGDVELVRWLSGGHREDDAEVISRLEALVDRPGRVAISGPFEPREAIARLGRMKLVMASRLHSAILAMLGGVPSVAIEYLPKTSGIMSMAVGEGWTIPITQVGNGRLLALARALDEAHDAQRARLAAKVPDLRVAAQRNAALAAELILRGRDAEQ